MNIDEIKSNWQQAGKQEKSQRELAQMMKVKHHPVLRRIRIQLIWESSALTAFLLLYYSMVDGDTKPLWANVVLVGSIIFYILNRLVGFVVVNNPVHGDDLIASLKNFLKRVRTLAVFSIVSATLYGLSLMLFLSVTVDFTPEKYLLMFMALAVFAGLLFVAFNIWKGRIRQLKNSLTEFRPQVE